jgi:UDP-2-acetamido-3-amino-2,3-dideoxy-glucuronate N-acetyltransferase
MVRKVPESSKFSIIKDAEIGEGTRIHDQVNIYKCKIGDNCKIRPFVFIPTGVIIEDNVFIGPNVTFTNDKYPRVRGEWKLLPIRVKRGASIGANSIIIAGVTIGENALVGAGSIVTKNVPSNAVVAGNPARITRYKDKNERC